MPLSSLNLSTSHERDYHGGITCALLMSLGVLIIASVSIGVPWAVRDTSIVSDTRMNGDLDLSLTYISNWNVTGTGKYKGTQDYVGFYGDPCGFCDFTCGYSVETSDVTQARQMICQESLAILVLVCVGILVSVVVQRTAWVYGTQTTYRSEANGCEAFWGCRCRSATRLFGEDFDGNTHARSRQRRRCVVVLFALQTLTWLPALLLFVDTYKRFNTYQAALCATDYTFGGPSWAKLICFANSKELKLEAGWIMLLVSLCCMWIALGGLWLFLGDYDRKTLPRDLAPTPVSTSTAAAPAAGSVVSPGAVQLDMGAAGRGPRGNTRHTASAVSVV
jgi:hypothetical protein